LFKRNERGQWKNRKEGGRRRGGLRDGGRISHQTGGLKDINKRRKLVKKTEREKKFIGNKRVGGGFNEKHKGEEYGKKECGRVDQRGKRKSWKSSSTFSCSALGVGLGSGLGDLKRGQGGKGGEQMYFFRGRNILSFNKTVLLYQDILFKAPKV